MQVLYVALFIVGLLASVQANASKYSIFCHWDTEASSRLGQSLFNVWNIDKKLCTHFVYGSMASLDAKGSGALQVPSEEELHKKGILNHILNARLDNNLTILVVGGHKEDSKRFSKMAASERKRDVFYISLTKVLLEREFSGVLLNWQFPTQQGDYAQDRDNFVTLLKELKIILKENKFLLLVTVSARMDKHTLAAYDIPTIAKVADFIILNTHSNQDVYNRKLDYISPLRGVGSKSVLRSVKHWVKLSKAPEKLILGVPLFGQTFTLQDISKRSLGDSSKGPGQRHTSSKRPGFMTYGEFCLQASKWQKQFDKQAEVPYAHKDDQWITYEDGRSISAKMHLIKDQRLGGAMAWSIDSDDFHGRCGESFPLLKVIVSQIGNPRALTTLAPHVIEDGDLCPKDGLFRNAWNCQLYYECRDTKRTDYECPDGDYFDEESGQCKSAKEVKCNENFVTWRPGQEGYSFRNLPLNLKVIE